MTLYIAEGSRRREATAAEEAAIRADWAAGAEELRRRRLREALAARVEAEIRRAAWARLAVDPDLSAEERALAAAEAARDASVRALETVVNNEAAV